MTLRWIPVLVLAQLGNLGNPNDAGYQAMANAFDLAIFTGKDTAPGAKKR
ncbi:MAG: hypothetical protein NTW28_13980 [Candidatus Solibacter sp.]|nr:hypothetical protein [Candidatus Solibacter sp.]